MRRMQRAGLRSIVHTLTGYATVRWARSNSSRYIGSLVADFHRTLLEGRRVPLSADYEATEWQAAAAVRGESAGVYCRAGRRHGDQWYWPDSWTSNPTGSISGLRSALAVNVRWKPWRRRWGIEPRICRRCDGHTSGVAGRWGWRRWQMAVSGSGFSAGDHGVCWRL